MTSADQETPEGVTLNARPSPTPTPQARDVQTILNACAATAEDLGKSRAYIGALEKENQLVKERLETEKRTTAVLTELNDTRRAESSALRGVVDAKNQTIAAKDDVIAKQEKLIEELKKKKTSIWKRLGDIAIGAALLAVFR